MKFRFRSKLIEVLIVILVVVLVASGLVIGYWFYGIEKIKCPSGLRVKNLFEGVLEKKFVGVEVYYVMLKDGVYLCGYKMFTEEGERVFFYTDKDLRYIFVGDLYDVERKKMIWEE